MKQDYFILSNALNQKKNVENLVKQTQNLSNFILEYYHLNPAKNSLIRSINDDGQKINYSVLLHNQFILDVTFSDSLFNRQHFVTSENAMRFNLGTRILPTPIIKIENDNYLYSQNAFFVPNDNTPDKSDTLIITYSFPILVNELDRIFEEQYFYLPGDNLDSGNNLLEIINPMPGHIYTQVPPKVCNQINATLAQESQGKLLQNNFFTERVRIEDTVYCATFLPVFNLNKNFEGYVFVYFIDGYHSVYFSEFIKRTVAATISLIIIFFLYYRNFQQQIVLVKQNIAIREDQKQLQIAKEKAEEANSIKSEFLANMSHEIRTPMNTVLGFTDLLNSQITDAQQKKYLAAITSGTKNLLHLINDILDLSKIEAGKMKIVADQTNLRMFFSELESVFSDLVNEKRLDFEINIDESVPKTLYLDEIRLKQIMFNLIGNAIKFTEKGFIIINAKTTPSKENDSKLDLIIEVKDSGIGIEKNYQNQIFNAFQQQDNKLSKKYGGTGLGLSISQKLAILMNGIILLESQQGVGSTFSLILKEVEQPDPELEFIPKKDDKNYEIKFENSAVLIVDDVGHNRFLIKEFLKNIHLTCYEAVNGFDAIEKARLIQPDLILMDIRMPGMDGLTATEILKSDSNLKHIPIVALSASVMEDEIKKIQSVGFDDFLRKPVKLADLQKSLENFLKHSQSVKINQGSADKHSSVVEKLSIENANAIRQVLLGEFYETWKNVTKGGFIDEIATFGNDLIRTGEKFSSKRLTNYGKELVDSAESFDVAKMKKVLKDYDELIENIK